MLSVLTAQESLGRINELAAGFGSMDKDAASAYLFRLRTAATIERAGQRLSRRPGSPQELAALMGDSSQMIVMEPGTSTTTTAAKPRKRSSTRTTSAKRPRRPEGRSRTPSDDPTSEEPDRTKGGDRS